MAHNYLIWAYQHQIFAGGENMHGKFEYVSAETMEKATQVIIEIVQLFEQQAK